MASSSFSANNPQNATVHAPNQQAGSTRHAFIVNPPPPGSGQKHSAVGLASGVGVGVGVGVEGGRVNAITARELWQADPVGTAHGSPPPATAATPHQEPPGDDGTVPSTVDTPSSTDAGPSAKKRKTARGSRGVANLTPDQLARKRANDREAQRAIRERQRLRTEQLEREIADLKATQPHRELQRERRQKEAIAAELAEVKRKLVNVMAILQPILGPGVGQSCTSPIQSHVPPHRPLTAPTTHHPASTPTSVASPVSVGTHGPWQHSLSPVATSVSVDGQQPQPSQEMGALHQQRYDLVHGLDLGADRLGLDFLVDPNLKIAKIQNGVNGAQDSPRYRHVPMKHDWTATISMIPGLPQTQSPIYAQSPVAGGLPPTSMSASTPPGAANAPPPIHALIPRNCPPTCPLDALLLDFLSERRQRAAEGLSQTEILGPRYPSVSSLLNPAVSVYSHPLSKVFTDILARFPDLSTLPERVGVLYLMFLYMRWQVAPTQENYLRLPSWFRPVRGQTEKEHPAWFDHIPFPGMREKLVDEYEPGEFPFDNFFIPFTSTLSVNWPYEDAYVLLASPTGEELMINPVFEQHMAVLGNWTLGPAFERAFPALSGCYNLRRENE